MCESSHPEGRQNLVGGAGGCGEDAGGRQGRDGGGGGAVEGPHRSLGGGAARSRQGGLRVADAVLVNNLRSCHAILLLHVVVCGDRSVAQLHVPQRGQYRPCCRHTLRRTHASSCLGSKSHEMT